MRGAHHASAGLPAKLTADLTARLNPFQRKVTEADVASTCQYNDLVEPRRGYHFQDNIPMSWHGCQWFSETSSSGLACKGQRLIESQSFFPWKIEGTRPLPHRIRSLQVKGALKMALGFVVEPLWERHVWLCQIQARPSGDHKGLHMPSSSLDDVKKPSTDEFC